MTFAVWIGFDGDAHAQEAGRTYRVGVLSTNRASLVTMPRDMLPRLGEAGFTEGRNLVLDVRVGVADQLPGLARDLAARSDVIVVVGILAIIAAGEATRTVPIVALGTSPTELGLAQSLGRPGGNVTGIAMFIFGLDRKLVELLHDAVPTVRRIAVLTEHQPVEGAEREDLIAAMANVGVEVRVFYADRQEEYPAAFAAMREAGMEAVSIPAIPRFFGDIAQLLALAREARLPTACADVDLMRAGCMLSYGSNLPALRRRLADYAVSILRGASPADSPIERPTQFELGLNLRTARALGLTLPQTLLDLADEVVE